MSGHRQKNFHFKEDEFKCADIAPRGAIVVPIFWPDNPSLIGCHAGVLTAAWCGRIPGIDSWAFRQESMGKRVAAII